MRLLFIRHGDPDYEKDSLTEKGWREEELLAERIAPMDIKEYYVSPLGRAQDTISGILKRTGRTAVTKDWLQEFFYQVKDPETGKDRIPWDFVPEIWTEIPEIYDKERWLTVPMYAASEVPVKEKLCSDGIDEILAEHGYRRQGNYYLAEQPNEDTLVFVCHFGQICVLLGHILGIAAPVLWHTTIAAPTSVTTLITEERRPGKAQFRMTAFGDVSHLYVAGEPPAFSGRFCEKYTNTHERHD